MYGALVVIHWPVAFVPGKGYFPPDPKKEGWVELDLETSLVETWKAMIALPKSKVDRRVSSILPSMLNSLVPGPRHWCQQLQH